MFNDICMHLYIFHDMHLCMFNYMYALCMLSDICMCLCMFNDICMCLCMLNGICVYICLMTYVCA
jgi:hypothetical protein